VHPLTRSFAVVFLLSFCTFAHAATAVDDPTYTAIRGARPDGRTITLSNFAYDRDVYHIVLNGTLGLLAPVDGKTFGAVFIGQGTYELKPASPAEKRELALFTGDDKITTLSDQFDRAVFFSADLIKAAEGAAGAAKPGMVTPELTNAYEDYLKKQRKDFTTNIHVRILQEALNGGEPLFFAHLKGKKYPPAILVVDPLGAESLHLSGSMLGGEQTLLLVTDRVKGGMWYLSHLLAESGSGQAQTIPPLVQADRYAIDTTVMPRNEISGITTMTFTANAAIRVLPINIAPKLRLSEVSLSPDGPTPTWTAVAYVQEKFDEDSDAAVVFPTPLQAGAKYLLRFTYKGKDVLVDAGDGNFSVGARESWYPNAGTFIDTATYELTYRIPQKFEIVSVGTSVSDTTQGNQRVMVFKSDRPLRVAGFNYGRFKKMSMADKESGVVVDVYTNPGTPDIMRQINDALAAESEGGLTGPDHVHVDTGSLAQSALADGVNTLRTGNIFFGPLPDKHVAITQQSQWDFGQSWPSLIYLPYLAFLDGTTRFTLGLRGAADFVDQVGPHEFGHQWWGHNVGFRSYHDEWLSEGFAEFTAALVLQQTGGWPKYNKFWEKKRQEILERPRGATISNDAAGPISQGWRVSTWQSPGAYSAITYSKGAYVLHMLRMLMQDQTNRNPDAPFMAMMSDFSRTYAGKSASTADFQQTVEKHLVPAMKLTRNGKIDWFFHQWVNGTAIPKLDSSLTVTDGGGGKYHIKGSVTQSQVPDDFITFVPIYLMFDKGSFVRVGTVPMLGNMSKPIEFDVPLPKAPTSVTINMMHDVLAR
jgi:hypothetical protein